MTRTNIADLLCIGCQKGSTSWLHSVLQCHPDTWFFKDSEPLTSTVKEAHFWDWNRHRGIDWYRALMTPPRDDLRTMDFTPEYAFLSPEHIAECARLSPGARVIYILRDPLARAVSGIRMHMLWHFGRDHREVLTLGERLFWLMEQAKLDRHADYVGNLRRWQDHYDVLVLNYEDLHADRRASLARIMDHCGLDPARMGPEHHARLDRMLGERIWVSEPYTLDRGALFFLDGWLRPHRERAAHELGLTWTEGARMLAP